MKNQRLELLPTNGFLSVKTAGNGFDEFQITVRPDNSGSIFPALRSAAEHVGNLKAEILMMDVFGPSSRYSSGLEQIKRIFGALRFPVSWISGNDQRADGVTGILIRAVSGVETRQIRSFGKNLGFIYESPDAIYCHLGGIHTNDLSVSNADQATATLQLIEKLLKNEGMDFSNAVRTWCYLPKILSWHADFKNAREQFLSDRNMLNVFPSAITMVGASNPFGSAMLADVIAVKKKTAKFELCAVPPPLQSQAPETKSSFGKALEYSDDGFRTLHVSGMTAMDSEVQPPSEPGDLPTQIDQTMTAVKAVLESRRMGWKDISRSVAYFKHLGDAHLFEKHLKSNRIPVFPNVIANGEACRSDLLFEIELECHVS